LKKSTIIGRQDFATTITSFRPTASIAESTTEPLAGIEQGRVAVQIENVSKRFGHGAESVLALSDVSLEVRAGEFLCIVGASGCGKSSLLNLVAGLDSPTEGKVQVRSERTALMFQESALFPWLTVQENVDFPMRMRRIPGTERRRTVASLLESVHLSGFERKRPHELSGGMRQRVALARALAQDAGVLLMDEPFGSLDAMIRELLDLELERIWAERGLTVLFVTHDVREAVRLGSRVLLLSSRPGRIAAEFNVDIERPRRVDSPEVATLAAIITDCLGAEVSRGARI
jgi:NitT/TauT family transport system ATP-binding protein